MPEPDLRSHVPKNGLQIHSVPQTNECVILVTDFVVMSYFTAINTSNLLSSMVNLDVWCKFYLVSLRSLE